MANWGRYSTTYLKETHYLGSPKIKARGGDDERDNNGGVVGGINGHSFSELHHRLETS
ncbi:hypothetical protein ALC56_01525 [Trachymyrmex septentrionalis]|uniref:Uncharacterized protein n=1 Tax=Trachymyrmex septentrionalis TaxID=34720 RepID=A0A195FUL8_9HYME|nr:hypothetical protein ALC56_01525 [Trachymyrmex septentrionalis]